MNLPNTDLEHSINVKMYLELVVLFIVWRGLETLNDKVCTQHLP